MGKAAARMTDPHVCPMVTGLVPHVGGPIVPLCEPTVLTGKLPQARVMDQATCTGPTDMIAFGAFTVLVNGQPAARMGDPTFHGGKIAKGLPTVLIGDAGSASVGELGHSMVLAIVAAEGGNAAFAQMKQALIAAAKEGTPFCEQCMKGA